MNLILSHQSDAAVDKMIDWWSQCVDRDTIAIAYGGSKSEFQAINHRQKFFVEDKRLRTQDHQRELQSYTQVFQMASKLFCEDRGQFQFVHFAEYDHIPLVPDLNKRQIGRLVDESADVLGFHVARVDGTNHPHFLFHSSNPAFASYWSKITVRSEPNVVLSMFGSGSFWTREAFSAVARRDEPFPAYMEIYLPTLAHHLGFRVRDFAEQNRFVLNRGDLGALIESARRDGAWTLHPVKKLEGYNA